jgi:HAD superfamily phosphoserine phosphatase-like hydrolase
MIKIAFIDLEGTLVEETAWGITKDLFGANELSDKNLKLYKEGKISYEEWRRELARLWRSKKIKKEHFLEFLKNYGINPFAKELIQGLKNKGYKIVVVTGAINIFAELVKKELGFDEFYSGHEFIFDKNGFFYDIKDHEEYKRGQGKLFFINQCIGKEKTTKENCIAIGGDDINDYWMLKELKSFSVKPHINKIKNVVFKEVNNLKEILEYV